jgi:putative spermidine/putrescine transport system substrate-binding protein
MSKKKKDFTVIGKRLVLRFSAALIGAAALQISLAIAQNAPENPVMVQAPAADSSALDWLSDEKPRERQDARPGAAADRPAAPERTQAVEADDTDDAAISDTADEASQETPAEPSSEEIAEQTETPPAVADDQTEPATGTQPQAQTAPADTEPDAAAGRAEAPASDAQPATAAEQAPAAAADVAIEPEATPAQAVAEPAAAQPAQDPATGTVQFAPADAETAQPEIEPRPEQAQTVQPETDQSPEQAQTSPAQTDDDATASDAADEQAEFGQAAPAEDTGSEDATQPQLAEEPAIDPKDVTLKIGTWAGAYGQAQERALFRPFVERHGYQVESVAYDGDYQALEAQADNPEWSLVDLNGDAMKRACEEDRLEKLDTDVVEAAPDGTPLSQDFLPGAIHPCGIGSVAWSAVIVYDNRIATTPASIEDVFDTVKIPGKRLFPKQPRYSLELALMADGVAPDQVYSVLQTPAGQDRAFAKLSSIKDDIVWWEKPSEVFGRIAEKDAVMGLGFNGRAFMAIMAAKQPLEILWDRQIYSYDYWAIPRGAPFQEAAKAFIRFATSPGPLSEQARWIPYGPARRSAAEQVGQHPELGLDMKPYLPTSEQNFVQALNFDGAFWRANEAALKERFAGWIEGRQLPVQKQAVISQ